jgi:hypothetical protein
MIVLLILLSMMGFSAAPARATNMSSAPARTDVNAARPVALYSHLPLSFEKNQGQTDPQVKFLARGGGYTLFLATDEAVLVLRPPSSALQEKMGSAVVRLKLLGIEREARISGVDELRGESNYFIGNDPRQWRTHVPTYGKVRYSGIYRGVDLVYYGRQGQLEYDLSVAPGADLGRIRLRLEGAREAQLDGEGDLVLEAGDREVRFHRPEAYQIKDGQRHRVAVRYVLRDGNRIEFRAAAYDHRRPLIIDPALTYSTYLGGTGADAAYGIAVDASGSAYVTGTTASSNFPVISAVQTANAGSSDAFVAKLNPDGSGLIYSTFLGGSGEDKGAGIVVDSAGNAYISGTTYSPNFPALPVPTKTAPGAFQSTYGGNGDAFITKLNTTGSALVYSSYLGGSGSDAAQGVAIDSSGNAYLTGSTQSSDLPTVNPLQIGNNTCSTSNGVVTCGSDAFLAKVSPTGTSLVYSTYLGGSNADLAQAIAVDSAGNAYIAGYTYSTDFPTQNAFQSASGGGVDAFISMVDATGTTLSYSTYLGGSGQDRAFGLTLDAVGTIYVTGDTTSANFPTTANAFQSTNAGNGDAFVSKLALGGSILIYSTLLGGTSVDQGTAIALDSGGNAYVTGSTQSSDFHVIDPLQKILGIFGANVCAAGTCPDAFVAKLRPSGQVVYSTFLGGSGSEVGQAVAVDSAGDAYVAGSTSSANFPATVGALQGSYAGSSSTTNAFVAKISESDLPALALSPQQLNFGNQALNTPSDPLAVTLINAGSAPLIITRISASGDFAETNNCGAVLPPGGGTCTIQVTFTPAVIGPRTDQITIADNAAGSPHSITVTGTGVASSAGSLTITPTSLNFPTLPIGVTSPVQTVQIANNGKASIIISSIGISAGNSTDFAETNTCGSLPTTLNVGNGCSVIVAFTPTSTGTRTATLVIATNAAGGQQAVTLSGIGNPVFSLSANVRSNTVLIGTTSTTFYISAIAPNSLVNPITLSCPQTVACSFNPASITGGETSTLTVGNLYSSTSPPAPPAAPVNFTVTGQSSGQSAGVTLTVFFSDFTVSALPPLQTVSAGGAATYTVTITPTNGFNGVVQLGCPPATVPAASTCVWTPPAVQLNGVATTATLNVQTTHQSGVWKQPPTGGPPGWFTGFKLWMFLAGLLSLCAASLFAAHRHEGDGRAGFPIYRTLAAASMLLAVIAFANGCNSGTVGPIKGTPSATYTVTITGTLGTNHSVVRSIIVNLAVTPG